MFAELSVSVWPDRVRVGAIAMAVAVATMCGMSRSAVAADDAQSKPSSSGIQWHPGPYKAALGDVGQIDIPQGYKFADKDGTRRLMELTQNPSSEGELGTVVPEDGSWFIVFDFDEIGYVKDDEKASLDADKILATLKRNAERSNELRKQRGWPAFHLVGWSKAPFYDDATHNLTWATLGQSDDAKEGQTVNYSTRLLGRRGAMSADLVIAPEQLQQALPAAESVLKGYSFLPGNRYAEFVKGDKVATYGLTALIAGGAAAAVVKTGLLTKLIAALAAFWKVIAVAFAAMFAAIKRFFVNLKSKLTGESRAGETAEEREQIEASIVSSDRDPR